MFREDTELIWGFGIGKLALWATSDMEISQVAPGWETTGSRALPVSGIRWAPGIFSASLPALRT